MILAKRVSVMTEEKKRFLNTFESAISFSIQRLFRTSSLCFYVTGLVD